MYCIFCIVSMCKLPAVHNNKSMKIQIKLITTELIVESEKYSHYSLSIIKIWGSDQIVGCLWIACKCPSRDTEYFPWNTSIYGTKNTPNHDLTKGFKSFCLVFYPRSKCPWSSMVSPQWRFTHTATWKIWRQWHPSACSWEWTLTKIP